MSSSLVSLALLLPSVLSQSGVGTQIIIPRGDSPLGTPRTLDVDKAALSSLFEGGSAPTTNVLLGVYKEEMCHGDLSFPRFEEADFDNGGPSVMKIAKASWQDAVDMLGPCEAMEGLDTCAAVLFLPRGGGCDSIKTDTADERGVLRVINEHRRLNIKYINGCDYAVNVLWRNDAGKEVQISEVLPGQEAPQNTFIGHIFSVRHAETSALVDWFQADASGSRKLECGNSVHDVENEVCVEGGEACAENEVSEEGMEEFLWEKEWQNRLALNRIQPRLVRNVTDVGFEKKRLPDDLLETLQSFFSHNSRKEHIEVSAGPVMNQKVVPTYMTHLGSRERSGVETTVKPVLEEWSNMELKMTSLYGIRKYVDGAVLNMHVDTGNTHVVSAIINVEQNVNTDWMLEIMDLDGNVHKVAMKPGDMVLYESAKVLHGRPEPLDGEFYANVFIHYMPVEGWDFQLRL